jgi:hypothetical protein
MAWLASDLLADIRRAASLPASSVTGLADADLLALADKEIQTALVPLMLRLREEFFVCTKSQASQAAVGQYRLPARAIGARVRDVRYVYGGTTNRLTRIEPEDAPAVDPQSTLSGVPQWYYLEGEFVRLLPTPADANGSIEIKYFCRPGRLTVDSADFRVLSSVAATSVGFSSWSNTGALDFVRGGSGFSTLFAEEISPTLSSATSATVAAATAALLVAGDYLCVTDKTPLIPLPVELHGVLSARCVAAVLRQLGRYDEAANEERNAQRLESNATNLLSPRVDGAVRKVRGSIAWRNAGRW